jgi:hypothetical protein
MELTEELSKGKATEDDDDDDIVRDPSGFSMCMCVDKCLNVPVKHT